MDSIPSGIPAGGIPAGIPTGSIPAGGLPDLNFSFPPGLKDAFIAAFVESILFGAYLPIFLECVIVLRRKKLANANHWYLVATTVSMFGLITARCIFEVNGCVTTFNDITSLLSSVESSAFFIEMDYAFLTAIADAFLIFRTYIVWNKSWRVTALPGLLYLASCGTSIYSLVVLKNLGPDSGVLGQNVIDPGDIFLICTLCTNLLCTGLISFKIIRSYKHADPSFPGSRQSESLKIISVLVESAAINTCFLVGLLVTTRLNSLVSFILSGCSSPLIGLTFSLIVVRVGRGTSYGDNATANSSSLGAFSTERPESMHMNFELNSRLATRSGARSEVQVRLDSPESTPRRRSDVNSSKHEEEIV
ncbi:hypothetical protein FB45DRAFT_911182 [Roridomyces roridus]|uniref:Uncharacterized protein n=1 Tax=Roridomyces roridus TaxID=1738132 RepID=A0AAD7FRQ2_9AGAR|nr:hypothetical protein FB45DRAFT_911182 [Roridomyces roridus]